MVQEKYNNIIAQPPKSVELQLTYCCNLHCDMCGQWGKSGIFRENIKNLRNQEITIDAWKNIIDQAAKWKSRINLWGGEPFLKKDIFKIIKYIKSKKLKCSVVTNGVLIDKYYKEIIDSKLDKIFLSIDGTREIHDKIRGKKGTFDKILKGINSLHDLKRKKNLKKPYIEILCTINKDNNKIIDKMPQVSRIFNADKLDLALLMFASSKTANDYRKEFTNRFGFLPKSQNGWILNKTGVNGLKLSEKINKMLYHNNDIFIKTIDNYKTISFKIWYAGSEYRFGFNHCLSPWLRLNIMPNGKANFCIDFPDYIIGDVKKESLSKIWNSEKAKIFREKYLKEGPLPICNRCCWLYNNYSRLIKEWKHEG